ncbi:MAG: IclR family transcriptional regulator [Pseudomonadota bacterium]
MEHDGSTGTLGKAIAVLDAIARADKPVRFRDLRSRVGQPAGTLHRNISNLMKEGLVQLNPDQSYALGNRLLKFAAAAWSNNKFREIAEPHLTALHRATGETVHLGALEGVEVIYLDKVESRQSVRMHSQVGNSSPAYCTGVGKAAMSALPEEEALRRADAISFHQFTATTITDAMSLLAELKTIASEGYAFDREEHETGIHCLAAPIRSPDHTFYGGISVTAPSYRVDRDQLAAWIPLVKQAANAITNDISIHLGPRA